MLKKNIALILTLNIICVIACGLQVNADDNMIWTDSFSKANQPAGQTYTSSLFNGITTNYSPLVSVVEEDGNAVMKISRNTANTSTQYAILKSNSLDLSGGKELIFKEKFKVSAGDANYALGLLSTSTAAYNVKKEGFLYLRRGKEKIFVGTDYTAADYSKSFYGASFNTWFTYEARLKIDANGNYTVDNYVFKSDGTLFFHPKEYASTTPLTPEEITDLQIRTGVLYGYAPSTSFPDPYEMCIDDCSVIVYQRGESGGLAFSSPANQEQGVRLDSDVLMTFTDLLGDNVSCTVIKDGELLDESLYRVVKTAFSLKLIFNSDLVKSSLYNIAVTDADGEKGSFSFETEKGHGIEMSLLELSRYDAEAEEFVPLTELATGTIQAKLLINDPLKYSLLSGIVTSVLYRDGKMIWIDGTDFSEELADGEVQITAEFDLPTGTDGDELKFMLFDSDLSWMPLNEGVVWLQK